MRKKHFLEISEDLEKKIEKVRRQYQEGLIPENEFYNKFLDSLVKEFYMVKMPVLISAYESGELYSDKWIHLHV